MQTVTMPDMEQIRQRLRLAKDASGESNASLAERSGISKDCVAKFFGGASKTPSFVTVAALAVALGLSLDELIGRPAAAQDLPEAERRELETLRRYCDAMEQSRADRRALSFGLVGLIILLTAMLAAYMTLDFIHADIGLIRDRATLDPRLAVCVFLTILLLLFLAHHLAKRILRASRKKLEKK